MAFILDPEVAGGLGPATILDASTHPPLIEWLQYEIDIWLGDDILETFPCYIVTERLMLAIKQAGLSGVIFADLEILRGENSVSLQADIPLPWFVWMKIKGVALYDDFWITEDYRLGVSNRAMSILRSYQLNHCEVEDFS